MLGGISDMAIIDDRGRAAMDHFHTARQLAPEDIVGMEEL